MTQVILALWALCFPHSNYFTSWYTLCSQGRPHAKDKTDIAPIHPATYAHTQFNNQVRKQTCDCRTDWILWGTLCVTTPISVPAPFSYQPPFSVIVPFSGVGLSTRLTSSFTVEVYDKAMQTTLLASGQNRRGQELLFIVSLFLWRLNWNNCPQNSCIQHSQIDDQHHKQNSSVCSSAIAYTYTSYSCVAKAEYPTRRNHLP